MIDGVTVRTTGFTQCAVCKIDLKGRFVYIDENIEELLGYTKEELFGKSLLHFLDETSQEIINQLLLNRNHYETFYDTTTITLISRRNQPVVARTVFSLNFIAGNPVNFQLVLDVEQTGKHSPNRPVGLMSLEGFLEGIMALESPSEFRGFLGLLRKFTGAHQASLYLIDDKTLEPRSGASDDNSVEFAFTSIPETTALHQRVAESGEIYSFTDEDAVQNAIEEDGTAPNEFVSRLSFDGFRQYLLRLIFSENTEPASMQVAITNTMLALRLVPPLMQIDREGDTASDPTIDVKFTVGFLGNLGIGAILTQSDGRIVGYNQALLEMLGNSKLGDYYTDLIRFLETHTSADLEESVARHFLSSVTDERCEDLRIPVRFPSGKEQLLIVTRLSDADGDLSACMVLLPWSASRPDTMRKNTDHRLIQIVIESLRPSLETITDNSVRLAHEYYRKLGDQGNVCLRSLDDAGRHLNGMFRDLETMLHVTGEIEDVQLTDLNILVTEVIENVYRFYPEVNVVCNHKELPKIWICRKKLTTVFQNLFSNSIKFNDNDEVVISIEAVIDDGLCQISILDNGIGIPEQYLQKIFDFFYRVPSTAKQFPPGSGMGLGITRELIQSLGGEITVTPGVGEGTRIILALPAECDDKGVDDEN